VGELNYAVLEQLDTAHTETFGAPRLPKSAFIPSRQAILVSGHDLHDLYQMLVQTQAWASTSTPTRDAAAHGYPKLKAFSHLAGNYGVHGRIRLRSLPPSRAQS